MQVAARRPSFAAGVALVGASAIIASAVTPTPDIHLPNIEIPAAVHAANVQLAALANPLEVYAKVFQTAFDNINTLAQNTVPGQLLGQLITNQITSGTALFNGLATAGGGIANQVGQVPAELTTAVGQLAAGNVEGAVNTLLTVPLAVLSPALNLLPVLGQVLTQPLTNLVKVINKFTADPLGTLLAVSGLIAPIISIPASIATAVQNVLSAVGTGDLGKVANALLSAPATVIDGALNGGYGPDLGAILNLGLPVKAGGLLSSATVVTNPDGSFYVNTGGPLYSLQQIIKMITDAITPAAATPVAATAAIAALPATDPTTVTLTTATAPTKTATETDTATTATDATAGKTATDTTTSTEKPADTTDTSTEPAKDATDTTASTPATTKDGSETAGTTTDSTTTNSSTTDSTTTDSTKTDSATKDSSTKDSSTKDSTTKDSTSSPSKKPTDTGTDVKSGNKVEPKSPSGESTKTGGSSTAAGKDGASASSTSSAGGAEKSADKGAGAASKSSAS
jgi:hypothetical protein